MSQAEIIPGLPTLSRGSHYNAPKKDEQSTPKSTSQTPSTFQSSYNDSGIRLDFGQDVLLIGREQELATLEKHYKQVQATQVAGSVFVSAEAGNGKSRLMEAFQDRIPFLHSRQQFLQRERESDLSNGSRNQNANEEVATGEASMPPETSATPLPENDGTPSPPKAETNSSPSITTRSASIGPGSPPTAKKMAKMRKYNDNIPNTGPYDPTKEPPVVCTAKFEEGETVSSKELRPIIQVFAQMTDRLLATTESRKYWKPRLSLDLAHHIPTLLQVLPENIEKLLFVEGLRTTEDPVAEAPAPPLTRLTPAVSLDTVGLQKRQYSINIRGDHPRPGGRAPRTVRRPGRKRPTNDLLDDSSSEDISGSAEVLYPSSISNKPHQLEAKPESNSLRGTDANKLPSTNHETADDDMRNVDKIHFALREYLRRVCKELMIIFNLEDIQRAGPGAIALLRVLLSDNILHPRKVFFVLSHRPLDEGHPAVKLQEDLANMSQSSAAICKSDTINLQPLGMKPVVQIMSRVLQREEEEVSDFADLVHRKTGGNVFFVVEFMRLLEKKGLVFYSFKNTRFEWVNLTDITARTDISDNVVDMVADKLIGVTPDMKLALLTAAIFGMTRFTAPTVFNALPGADEKAKSLIRRVSTSFQMQKNIEAVTSVESLICILEEAVDEGYLESVGRGEYKFAHDRIREAVETLLPRGLDLNNLHLRIGRQLKKWMINLERDGQEDDKLLWLVVQQLNQASDLIQDVDERLDLSELNYAAAESAIRGSSFFPASDFLRKGISLLGDCAWVDHYDNMIKMAEALMRMDYCCSRLYLSFQLADDILQNARTFDDKKMAYHIKILWLTQNGAGNEALDLIISVLDELGSPVPKNFLRIRRFFNDKKTNRWIGRMSEEKLLSLPTSNDPNIENIASFMERLEQHLLESCSIPNLLELVQLRMVQLTLKHGRFSMTPACFVSWAWYQARIGNYGRANRYGKLGAAMAKEGTGGYHDASAILMFHKHIYHWRSPYHDGIAPTSSALQKLWNFGAIELVFKDTITYLQIYFCCGLRLDPLANDIKRYIFLLRDYGNRLVFVKHVVFFRLVASLIGSDGEENYGLAEALNTKDLGPEWNRSMSSQVDSDSLSLSMMKDYLLGDTKTVAQLALKVRPLKTLLKDEDPDVFFLFRLFIIGMANLSSYLDTKRSSHRRKGKEIILQMQKWDDEGVVNVHHMLLLLRAEYFAGLKTTSFDKARKYYDEAISVAGRLGFLHVQALGNERAGLFCAQPKIDEKDWATSYLAKARDLYTEWGALEKVGQMNKDYHAFLNGARVEASIGSAIKARTRLGEISRETFRGLRGEGGLRLSSEDGSSEFLM